MHIYMVCMNGNQADKATRGNNMFNKRHYEAIALEMQRLCPELPVDDHGMYDDEGYDHDTLGRQLMWDDMIDRLAIMFHIDNPRFDAGRFRHACKPGRNVKARTAHLKVVGG